MFNPRKHFGIDYTRGNKSTHGKPSHTRGKEANRIRIDHTRGKKLNTDLYNDQNYQRVSYVEDHSRQRGVSRLPSLPCIAVGKSTFILSAAIRPM
jgi:hypothetical protein